MINNRLVFAGTVLAFALGFFVSQGVGPIDFAEEFWAFAGALIGAGVTVYGAIAVASEPGGGTTVRVLFPVTEALVTADDLEVAADEATWRGSGRVLIIDDESIVRKISRQMMELLGFDVVTAVDGLDGVDAFRRQAEEIVLVLLDLSMPRMNGENAFAEIRRIRPDARIVVVSGYDEQEALHRFEGQDLAGFLQKPYRLTTLRQRVRAALES